MTSFVQTAKPVSEQILDLKILTDKSLCEVFFSHPQTKKILSLIGATKEEAESFFIPFIHSSFTHESGGVSLESNEKLEFLGDALLSVIVSENLMNDFKDFSEGELSKFRASLVNENMLGILARHLLIHEILIVGKGATKEGIYRKDGPLADSIEALLGYFYQYRSLEGVKKVFEKVIKNYELASGDKFFDQEKFISFDSKTKLQELTMKKYKTLPEYQAKEIPQGFEVSLILNNKEVLKIIEASKKRAERKLAEQVLKENLL